MQICTPVSPMLVFAKPSARIFPVEGSLWDESEPSVKGMLD